MGYTRMTAEGTAELRRFTPDIFDDLYAMHRHDPTSVLFWYDDFLGYNKLTTSGAFGKAPYYGFIENSSTIQGLTTEVNGVVQIASGATADNSCGFGMAHQNGQMKIGVGSPGSVTALGGRVAFEARVRFPDITDGDGSVFIGITEEARQVDNGLFSDAHAVAQVDLLGFWVVDSNNDLINFGYNVASGTAQSVGTTAIAAETTWLKLGFLYDFSDATSQRISWFVDGVKQGTYVTGANIAASTFPGGEEMGFSADAKTDASAAMRLDIDWVCWAAELIY